ncbi:extracellular solute-binding protein [Paenibacillus hodogayensis]|uniref:Extracellular solute-binding protein n=1 Tax=Paenibacillus hodogayensis TaxID=279208 RepID=A0ABV5VWI9_9BACL
MTFKKLASLSLVTVMATGLTAACGDKNTDTTDKGKTADGAKASAVNATGFPIVNEPIKLTFFAGKATPAPANWNELPVWKEYAKQSNIEIDFQLSPEESLTEKRNLVLTGGNYPDAFHTARFSSIDVANYGAQGIFIPLNDLIDKYAPNFKKLLDKYPEVRKGMTMPDGKIYSFPTFYDPDFKSVIIGTKLWYNQALLDKVNMKAPETTDQFYDYLKAVKALDPKNVPYAASGLNTLRDELKGAWGLGNRGNMHPRVDMDPKTNKLRFTPVDPNYKELLEYMNKMYKEGLMIDNILTIKSPEVNTKLGEGVVGSSETNSPHTISGVTVKNFVGAPALKGPHGDQVFSRARSPLIDVGAFVITNKNKYPEATVRWIDHFFSEEGSKLFFMGVKGLSYEEKADGTLEYTEEFKKDQSKFVSWAGGYYPGLLTSKTFKGGEASAPSMAGAKLAEPYWPKEVWPSFTYTQDELLRFNPLSTDINKYVDEMTTKFIVGDVPFTEWDKYVSTLNKMGLDEYLKIYTAAYERYSKN